MPHFHLNLYNSTGFVPDLEGQELADEAAARAEAIRGIRSILSAEVLEGHMDLNGRVEIMNARGSKIGSVLFTEAVRIQAVAP